MGNQQNKNINDNNPNQQLSLLQVKIGVRLSAKVKDLLEKQLQQMHEVKQRIYSLAIKSLNDQDKDLQMVYIKCNQNTVYDNQVLGKLKITAQKESYNYKSSVSQDEKIWYVNFSDKNLFGYYNTKLFAQDEVQCCEFPLLPYIKQYIMKHSNEQEGLYPVTKVGYQSYPILIMNCQQLCKVNLFKTTNKYKNGIYGNQFANLQADDIKEFFEFPKKEDKKEVINLICMSALSNSSQPGQSRYYKNDEIVYTFETVYRAFYSAAQESRRQNQNAKVVINTGNWGSGAFGNNLQFTVLVQLTAAHLAKVDEIKYFTFDEQGEQGFQVGQQYFLQFIQQMQKENVTTSLLFQLSFIKFCLEQNFVWGYSNGF